MALRRRGIVDPIRAIRISANHVFRAGDVVVRVAPASADAAGQVALARWLRSEGFPVAEPLADVEPVGDAQVSLWEHIEADEGRPIDFEQLGEIVARLHQVAPDAPAQSTSSSAMATSTRATCSCAATRW